MQEGLNAYVISYGHKTVEIRLLDEKRSKISVGDYPIFMYINTGYELDTIFTGLKRFILFDELYAIYPKCSLVYCLDEPCPPGDMESYYSKEQQKRYDVLAIEIHLCKVLCR